LSCLHQSDRQNFDLQDLVLHSVIKKLFHFISVLTDYGLSALGVVLFQLIKVHLKKMNVISARGAAGILNLGNQVT